jgi:hypothetical protein
MPQMDFFSLYPYMVERDRESSLRSFFFLIKKTLHPHDQLPQAQLTMLYQGLGFQHMIVTGIQTCSPYIHFSVLSYSQIICHFLNFLHQYKD